MPKSPQPLRLAVGALTDHIYVGYINKAGNSFLDGKQDVSSDFYKTVIDRFIWRGKPYTIQSSSGESYEVTVRRVYTKSQKAMAYATHITRSSDASSFDEICTVCGATDAPGSDALHEPCPGKRKEKSDGITTQSPK
jgi:hypothetical protein